MDHFQPSGDLISNGNIAISYLNTSQNYVYLFVLEESGTKVYQDKVVHRNQNQNGFPYLITLANKKSLVTWSAVNVDGPSGAFGILAKIYYNDLEVYKDEFVVNSYIINDQKQSKACLLENGNFAIAWSSYYQDSYSNLSVMMQLFYKNGDKLGGEIAVTSSSQSYDEALDAIASLKNGIFVWMSMNRDKSDWGVFGYLFNIDGTPIGAHFQENQIWTLNSQLNSRVAALRDGKFIVVWQGYYQNEGKLTDNSMYGIYMKIFDKSANRIGSNSMVNDTTSYIQGDPFIRALLNGTFIITWVSEVNMSGCFTNSLEAQQCESSLQVKTMYEIFDFDLLANSYFYYDKSLPQITTLYNGNHVIIWNSLYQDNTNWDVM